MNTVTQSPADWTGFDVVEDRTVTLTPNMAAEIRTTRYHRADYRQAMNAAAYNSKRHGGKPVFVYPTCNGYAVTSDRPSLPMGQTCAAVMCDGSEVRRVRLVRNA